MLSIERTDTGGSTLLRTDTKAYWHYTHSTPTKQRLRNYERLSVRRIIRPPHATAAGLLYTVSPAGRRYRSTAGANASSATFSAYVGSWTETCLHSLVLTVDKMKSEMSRKCRTDQCHCSDTRMIFFKSVNIWQSYRQKRDCLVHFLCLLAVCWPGAQSAWDNYALTCNYAKYSPIKKEFSHSYIQQ